MGFFDSWETHDTGAAPRFEGYNDRLANFAPKTVYKPDKKFLKRMEAGGDVSSEGWLNSIRQVAAAQRRDIGDRFMYGQNALLESTGGEQANLVNRARELAMTENQEQEGENITNAMTARAEEARGAVRQGKQLRQSMMLEGLRSAAGNELDYYRSRYQPVQKQGWLSKIGQVAGLVGQVGSVAMGLPGMPKAGGGSLPVNPSYSVGNLPPLPSYNPGRGS